MGFAGEGYIFLRMIFTDSQGHITETPPQVSFLDHGFLFGDSIYEVVRLYHGHLFGWEEHKERLILSGERLGISIQDQIPIIEERLKNAFQTFGQKNAVTRVVVTRGVGRLHIDYRSCKTPNILMATFAMEDRFAPASVRVMIPKIRRNHRSSTDPSIKSGNYLNNVLALREAVDAGFDDALLLNTEGFVTELTTSNIAWMKNGKVEMPSMNSGILYGITRHYFLKFYPELSYEGEYNEDSLEAADEIFALSTLKEICPVSQIQLSDGEIRDFSLSNELKALKEDFAKRIASEFQKSPAIV